MKQQRKWLNVGFEFLPELNKLLRLQLHLSPEPIYIYLLQVSIVSGLLLLVGSVIVNVEPYPSFDSTESEPCSCSMILLQMLSPRPCPYPFCFKLAGLVDLNEGLNIRSYSSSDIPMPLSVTKIFNSTSSESLNSCKLIRTSIESCGFVNFRAFDRRLIVTC